MLNRLPQKDTIQPRVARACLALSFYREQTRAKQDSDETTMTDLLADLMHACNRFGINFDERLQVAQMHVAEERAEAGMVS